MTKEKAVVLKATIRKEIGKQVENLRDKNIIPAVLYGHKTENKNLAIKYSDFEKAYNKAGESELIDLVIDNEEPIKILIHDIARHITSNQFLHADLYQVNMKEKVRTEVELNFIGEAPAVKELGGILLKALDHIEIECLPANLISHIDIDLSTLKTFDDIIRVKDLSVPETIEVLTEPETTIATVNEQTQTEEPEIEETKEAEVEGKEKKEESKEKTSSEEK